MKPWAQRFNSARGYSSRFAKTHGMSRTPEYNVWLGMLTRCCNPDNENYQWYGARGIQVCERWLEFTAFYADMGPRPAGTTLDRIDNDGNYEPTNCRWATRTQQHNNRQVNRHIEFNGERLTVKQWADKLEIPYSRLEARIRRGWSIEDALLRPRTAKNAPRSEQRGAKK